MPDVVTPAQLAWTGGTVLDEPAFDFVSPAILRWTGVSVTESGGVSTALSVTAPTLDRLHRAIDKAEGETDKQFQRRQLIWQQTMEAIEAAFAALSTQVGDNTTVIARLLAAEALASAANDNAAAVTALVNIADSYPDPPGVLTASNDGTIAIAAHSRVYADGTRVAVNAGNVAGFANGANVTVYYVDAAREGGAVAYQGTTSPVAQAVNTHVVGVATIPAVGEVPAQGVGVQAPGVMTDEQAQALGAYAVTA